MDRTLSADRVVNLLRYKRERGQRQLDFEGRGEGRRPAAAGLAPVTPFRTLTARELDHRQRMLSFLTSR